MSALEERVANVVEQIVRRARSAVGCPLPPRGELRAFAAYVVDKIAHTRGEYVTISVRLVKRYVSSTHLAAACIVAWLGVDSCVVFRRCGKVVLSLPCAKEKLGL